MATRKSPIILDEVTQPEGAISPVDAPAVLDESQRDPIPHLARPSRSVAMRLFLWASGVLLGAILINAVWGFVLDMMARGTVLGQVALGLVALFLAAACFFILSEWHAYRRISHLSDLQDKAKVILKDKNLAGVTALRRDLKVLYRGRAHLTAADAALVGFDEMFDAELRFNALEAAYLTPLDHIARAEIAQAARRVASLTALLPLGVLDMILALWINLRMIRRLAEIYGGRTGSFGAWRLLRAVIAQLLATGALVLGDDLISSTLGGSLAAKLSRRFGEGVFNGAMTARLGLIAMELCRPLPFVAAPRPSLRSVLSDAFSGLFKGANP